MAAITMAAAGTAAISSSPVAQPWKQSRRGNSDRQIPLFRQRQQRHRRGCTALSVTADLGAAATSLADASAAAGGDFPSALVLGVPLAGVAAYLVLNQPQARTATADGRSADYESDKEAEKDEVRNYFNTSGFDRWRRIYGEADDVNSVQLDIREGHAQTVEKVLNWFKEEGSLQDITVCDAGCGTGSLTIPLALQGAKVYASDISAAMCGEAKARAEAALAAAGKSDTTMPQFEAVDLESVTGKYHTVACLDVFIHYPQDQADGMVQHLASLAEKRLIISFAPYTPYYALLKKIGELFPGPSKTTRAYLHAEDDVVAALEKVGWKVVKREMTATKFYFSRLLEAVPANAA